MRKPVIGIVGKPQMHRENDYWHRLEMVDEIRILLADHGAVAVMLLPTEKTMVFNDNDLGDDTVICHDDLQDLYQQLSLVDGLILQGGDVSCQYEVELARKAIELDKPVLGICAGFNNILRALGSNTYEQKREKTHSHYDVDYRHRITIAEDTKMSEFAGSETYQVNSFHTMVVEKENVEPFAKVSSWSDDSLVESFELPDKRFVVAVKWHPEQMRDDKLTDKLMTAFVEECRRQYER